MSNLNETIFSSPPFKFIVEGKAFYVHPPLVARCSKSLESIIHVHTLDFTLGSATLENVDLGTFARFVEWMYTKDYTAAESLTDIGAKEGAKEASEEPASHRTSSVNPESTMNSSNKYMFASVSTATNSTASSRRSSASIIGSSDTPANPTTSSQKPLFGGTSSTAPAPCQKPLFGGSSSQTPASSQKPLFGASPSTVPASSQKPLFGASPSTAPTSFQKSLFGASPSTAPTSFQKSLFGASPSTTSAWGQKPLFGGPSNTATNPTASSQNTPIGGSSSITADPTTSSHLPQGNPFASAASSNPPPSNIFASAPSAPNPFPIFHPGSGNSFGSNSIFGSANIAANLFNSSNKSPAKFFSDMSTFDTSASEPSPKLPSLGSLKETFQKLIYCGPHLQLMFRPSYRNRSPSDDYTEIFLSHARMYGFAGKYDIQPLQSFATQRLQHVLKAYDLYPGRVGDITSLIRYIYSNTTASKDGSEQMRELLTHYVRSEMETLVKSDIFRALLEEGGPFAGDFLRIVCKIFV